MMDEPTAREKLFAREYLLDFNATRAARAIGAPKDACGQRGHELLNKPRVAYYIGQLVSKRIEQLEVTEEELLKRYSKIIRADRRNIVDEEGKHKGLHELDEDLAECVEGYKVSKDGVEIKLVSKRAAMRDYGETKGIFKQVQEINDTRKADLSDTERAAITKGLDEAF